MLTLCAHRVDGGLQLLLRVEQLELLPVTVELELGKARSSGKHPGVAKRVARRDPLRRVYRKESAHQILFCRWVCRGGGGGGRNQHQRAKSTFIDEVTLCDLEPCRS